VKIRLGSLFCLVLLSAGAASAWAGNPPLPDWVLTAANAKLPVYPPATEAVVLLEDLQVTVQPGGRAVERYREVIKILRQQGRGYAQVFVPFSNDYKLSALHVWSIGPDGRQYTVKTDQIREIGNFFGGMLYVDERAKVVEAPGADPGGIIAYEREQELPSYLSEETWYFQNPVPTFHSVFEVDLPASWKYYSAWIRRDASVPNEIAPNHWRWELQNVPGLDLEDVPMAPAEMALAGRLVVHYSANELPKGDARWAAIGDWYDALASARTEGPIEIASKARELTGGSSDLTARIQKVAEFMQRDIRYVGIEIGIGGLQPHSAADVFRNRYGDCKDKVTLMISMLAAVGVRSTYVLVDTHRGFVDPELPSIRGNHAIAAIELPPGYDDPRMQAIVTARTGQRYLIFDPTNQYIPAGLLPNYLQGGYGILVTGQKSQVIQLPTLKPDSDSVQRSAQFELTGDGTLKGAVTETLFGSSAEHMRRVFNELGEVKQREAIESALGTSFSNFTLESQAAQNAKNLDKLFVLNYAVTAKSYATAAGANLLLLRPSVLGSPSWALKDKARVYPINMGKTGIWRDSFDLKLPAGYEADELPAPMNIDVGFATFHSEVTADTSNVRYTRELVVKELELDPRKYGDLLKLQATITTDENNKVVLKKKTATLVP
jgi:hypothetical protein